MAQGRVFIIGGGLAGMVVAKELLERGVPVAILEGGRRLGGKAGADLQNRLNPDGSRGERRLVEHGYHIFPGWYRNTRALLRDLEIDGHLIDITKFHHLHRPTGEPARRKRRGKMDTYYGLTSLPGAARSMFSTSLPWHQALAGMYFLFDLMAEPFSQADYLDRISVNAFLRSRFYRSEAVAAFHNENVLQAASIPTYDLSAMTLQNVAKSFLSNRQPMFSILDGNLQETFIEPFERYLRRIGVNVYLKHRIGTLLLEEGRVSGLTRASRETRTRRETDREDYQLRGLPLEGPTGDDWYVLATPPEETTRLARLVYSEERRVLRDRGGRLEEGEGPLADVCRLVSAPMAAFEWYLEDKIPDLPAEHVNLYGSRYGISFIDISQHWPELREEKGTVLSIIASNFESLKELQGVQDIQHIADELREYFPDVELGGALMVRRNLLSPLFLNTTGAWPHRPRSRTMLRNLFVAGDYCQNEADLTTMEGAVISGLRTAGALLEAMGLDPAGTEPLPLRRLPRWQLLLAKYAMLPLIAPIGAYNTLEREWRRVSKLLS